jgi:1-acyl-sn-glycerol-3-phosphate acyltransferase
MKRPNSRRNRVWVANWLLRPLLMLILSCFFKITVVGKENVPRRGAAIFAITHPSEWDPPLIGIWIRRNIAFMAKASLFKHAILGRIFHWYGMIPVDRGEGDDAKTQRFDSVEHGKNVIRHGGIVANFFEGGCYVDGVPRAPKPGPVIIAQATDALMIPIHITDVTNTPKRRGRIPVTITIGEGYKVDHNADKRVATADLDQRVRSLGHIPTRAA